MARVIERPKARPGREAGNAAGSAGRGRWATVVLALPVVWTIAMGWSHRWIADDGFINVRVVSEVFAGHGPVFNPGERVEVASSPLWLSLLVVGRAVSRLETEWVAVLTGIVTTATAVAVAEVSAARFFRTWRLVPVGILGYVLLPPAWDYTTSGLENGLSILWIACVQLALVTTAHSRRPRQVYVTAALVGLGPLVRPDFVVMSIVFAVALVLVARPASWRRWLALACVGLALPFAYELFRAAYYGALMPNTAFAKEPEASKWAWGWRYLTDFADPYWLWLPLVFVAVVTVLLGRDRGRRDRVLLMAAPVAGLLHAFFVVRGGGDHMHARMLLPAWFALLLPAAAIPFRLPSRVAHRVGAAFAVIALGAWALVPVFSGGPPYTGYGPHGIDDERSVWVARSDLHPVTVDDYARDGTYLARYFIKEGRLGTSLRREHQGVLFGLGFRVTPTKRSAPAPVVAYGAIGMISVVGGPELYIADVYNLADPIGARFGPSPFGRPGHEKWTPVPWLVARYTEGAHLSEGIDPREVADARRALQCPIVRRLLARATAPLTPSRALTNVLDAFRLHGVRISSTPGETARECARNH